MAPCRLYEDPLDIWKEPFLGAYQWWFGSGECVVLSDEQMLLLRRRSWDVVLWCGSWKAADEAFGTAVWAGGWVATSSFLRVNRAEDSWWKYLEGPEAHQNFYSPKLTGRKMPAQSLPAALLMWAWFSQVWAYIFLLSRGELNRWSNFCLWNYKCNWAREQPKAMCVCCSTLAHPNGWRAAQHISKQSFYSFKAPLHV